MDQRTRATALVAMIGSVAVSVTSAQKPTGAKSVVHDITVKAESVYTGTMDLAVDRGKVSGNLHLVAPTEIVGKVAGTSKAGVMTLDFPYEMTQRKCTRDGEDDHQASSEAGGCRRDHGGRWVRAR